jgi:probable phosphoglycerate mutase
MEKKKLYLLRHAQSEFNKAGIIQGDVDTPLSKEGREQAKEKAPGFKIYGFKNIAHSPLSRAKETAQYINEYYNIPMLEKNDLREMDFGAWSAHTKVEEWDKFRRPFYEEGTPPPGGESKNGLYKRVKNAVHEICMEIDDDPILVVAHGMVLRVLLGKWFTNDTEKEIRSLEMHNLSLYEVEVEYDAEKVLPVKYKYINIFEN